MSLNHNKRFKWILVGVGLSLSISTPVFAERTLTISNPVRSVSLLGGTSILVEPGLILIGETIQTIRCKLGGFKSGDRLAVTPIYSATPGSDSSLFSQAYDSTSGILTITDPNPISARGVSGGAWQTLLRTLSFYPATVKMSQNTRRTVEYEVLELGKWFKIDDTYHFYDFVAAGAYSAGSADSEGKGTYWNGAKSDAESNARLYYGKRGYLATVTSDNENNFLFTQVNASDTGWLGGSDISTEGTWLWKTGPEAGSPFSYTSWNTNEPNNSSGEDYLQTLSSSSKKWNDLPGTSAGLGYFIEWGGMSDAATIVTIKIQNHNAIKHAAGF